MSKHSRSSTSPPPVGVMWGRHWPRDIEDALFDFLAFGVVFRLRRLCRGAREALERICLRRTYVRLGNAEWSRRFGAALWDMVMRCGRATTIELDENDVDETRFARYLAGHATKLRRVAYTTNAPITGEIRMALAHCGALQSLRLLHVNDADQLPLSAFLPKATSLRDLHVRSDDDDTEKLLGALAGAGVLLERLQVDGFSDLSVLRNAAAHPLHRLSIVLGEGHDCDAPLGDTHKATRTLRVALAALEPTLHELVLHWGYGWSDAAGDAGDRGATDAPDADFDAGLDDTDDGDRSEDPGPRSPLPASHLPPPTSRLPPVAPVPIWRGLERLKVVGDTAPPFAVVTPGCGDALRSLRVNDMDPADDDDDDRGYVASTAPDPRRAGAWWPDLRELRCRGPVRLGAVLAAWPLLETLAVTGCWPPTAPATRSPAPDAPSPAAGPDASWTVVGPSPAERRHEHLTALSAPLGQPLAQAWALPRLRQLTCRLPDTARPGEWAPLLRYLGDAADSLAALDILVYDTYTQGDDHGDDESDAAFPQLRRAAVDFCGKRRFFPLAAALLRRAPALESAAFKRIDKADFALVCSGGVFTQLRHLRVDFRGYHDELGCGKLREQLLRAVPTLRECGCLRRSLP